MSQDRNRSLLSVPPSTQDHIQGRLDATLMLVMYGDYQSFQSASVYRLIKVILRQFSVSSKENSLCFIFRHFPQHQIHTHAQHAAEAAEAAAVQDRFWQMHEMLFLHQQELGNGYLVEYANNLGLNIPRFLQDIFRGTHIDRINQDIESAYQSGVTFAPALFINRVRYTERWNIEQLTTAIVNASH
ncbi:DsbA family protein [Phormidium sp. LEGE 05292]|uniref:DsbA family protein n=1 Tax=[Phormidium] sp. LEGE 05292 TaxID=767427 RepID=UPI0018812806|nr:thioredoxin domain-containing protein [Phormidium sp. LEGE 05292]MBE9224489.1 DsbA family protein [Phormidium sp. LEGE 05292]